MQMEEQVWKKTISEFTDNNSKELFIFGAGKGGKNCLRILQQFHIFARCIDNNQVLWGTTLYDVPIESPQVLLEGEQSQKVIIIFDGIWKEEILSQLCHMDFSLGKDIYFFKDIAKKVQEELYKVRITSLFEGLQGKNILIYSVGIMGQQLAKALEDFSVLGVVDDFFFEGEIANKPVFQWEEIEKGAADVVIIATPEQEYWNIYQRIMDKCLIHNLDIYGLNGRNLIKEYGWTPFRVENAAYYRKSEAELKKLIEEYDAVSFDLFDTLIMRKTLLPTDVFDIVGDRLRRLQIPIRDFKVKRRAVEMNSGGNIYKIYETLGEKAGWNAEQVQKAMETELEVEKSVLLPRKKMVEIFDYAVGLGKKVNIISDMYLCAEILDNLLSEMNIVGYDKIYVSCDYGVSKGNGLFERYLQDVSGVKCLHIGDNEYSDVMVAKQYGIDAYGIKSAYDMIKVSNCRYIVPCANTCNERSILGLVLADIFNNPFALYNTSGYLQMDTFGRIGKFFAAPMIVIYLLQMVKHIKEHQVYHKVIFGARDGYLFRKLYEGVRSRGRGAEVLPDSVYMLTSRKLCVRATLDLEDNIKHLIKFLGDRAPEEVLTETVGLEKEELSPYVEKSYECAEEYIKSIEDYFGAHLGVIQKKALVVRERYVNYIKSCGLDLKKKYLFSDLISGGSVQYRLDQLFEQPIDGFYLGKRTPKDAYNIQVYSVYVQEYGEKDVFAQSIDFFEPLISSPDASVADMGEDNIPICGVEVRTAEQIRNMLKAQEGIEELFFDFYDNLLIENSLIKKELPLAMLNMCGEAEFVGECSGMEEETFYDDCNHQYYKVLKK